MRRGKSNTKKTDSGVGVYRQDRNTSGITQVSGYRLLA
jgi:hypothetical protein